MKEGRTLPSWSLGSSGEAGGHVLWSSGLHGRWWLREGGEYKEHRTTEEAGGQRETLCVYREGHTASNLGEGSQPVMQVFGAKTHHGGWKMGKRVLSRGKSKYEPPNVQSSWKRSWQSRDETDVSGTMSDPKGDGDEISGLGQRRSHVLR